MIHDRVATSPIVHSSFIFFGEPPCLGCRLFDLALPRALLPAMEERTQRLPAEFLNDRYEKATTHREGSRI